MIKPKRAGDVPIQVTMESDKSYAWCSCGESKNQPLCDGSHRGTGFSPEIYRCEKEENRWLCTCKQTAQAPFCDGSHKR